MKLSQQFSFDMLAFHLALHPNLKTENISPTKSHVVEMIQPWKSNCSWLALPKIRKVIAKMIAFMDLKTSQLKSTKMAIKT